MSDNATHAEPVAEPPADPAEPRTEADALAALARSEREWRPNDYVLVPLAALARQPVGDAGVSYRSLLRWATDGISVRGRRYRLRVERVGGRWYSTDVWLSDFLKALKAAALSERAPEPEVTAGE